MRRYEMWSIIKSGYVKTGVDAVSPNDAVKKFSAIMGVSLTVTQRPRKSCYILHPVDLSTVRPERPLMPVYFF